MGLKKWEILIVSSLLILVSVITIFATIFTKSWFSMILLIFLFSNALWTEFEKKKLAGKDPMTQSTNKKIIFLGGILIGISIIFLIISISNRNYTPINEAITMVLLLGGLTLILHQFIKRYRAVSYRSK